MPLLKSQRAENTPQKEARRRIIPTAPSGKFLLNLQTENMRHLDASWAVYSEHAEHLAPTSSVCSEVWAHGQRILQGPSCPSTQFRVTS